MNKPKFLGITPKQIGIQFIVFLIDMILFCFLSFNEDINLFILATFNGLINGRLLIKFQRQNEEEELNKQWSIQ